MKKKIQNNATHNPDYGVATFSTLSQNEFVMCLRK